MNPRIRIKDIAEKAGVSLGTVDRVLHNRGHVAAEVRAKVLRVVEELGYEPNIMASRLAASGRPTRISALIPNPDADPFWRQPCQGILRAAKAVEHYSVEVQIHPFDLFDPHSFSREARKLLDRHPDGVVVPALFLLEATRFLDNCHREHLPYALLIPKSRGKTNLLCVTSARTPTTVACSPANCSISGSRPAIRC
ncbi:MAG: LacI family DNA-binding transcriptional regulator [Saprospirales bacterium]|nr:LacI family DNA-binding transcriptional regulator [Saprospirales bacterium]